MVSVARSFFFITPPLALENEKKAVLVAFEFKGSPLSFDVGVWEQFYSRLDPEKIGTTIFSGSSSRSVLTVYFACNGLSAETSCEDVGLASNLIQKTAQS